MNESWKSEARSIAEEIAALPERELSARSRRDLPEDLDRRFIRLRGAMIESGLFDPLLVRYDSLTAPAVASSQVASRLHDLAGSD